MQEKNEDVCAVIDDLNSMQNTDAFYANENSVQGAVDVQQVQTMDIPDDLFECDNNPTIEIWGKALMSMKDSGDNLVYARCEGVTKTLMSEDGDFVLIVNNKNFYDELREEKNYNIILKHLTKFTDANVKLIYEELHDDSKDKIEFLTSKFGRLLKIKNN